jgi:hypothetical protein
VSDDAAEKNGAKGGTGKSVWDGDDTGDASGGNCFAGVSGDLLVCVAGFAAVYFGDGRIGFDFGIDSLLEAPTVTFREEGTMYRAPTRSLPFRAF